MIVTLSCRRRFFASSSQSSAGIRGPGPRYNFTCYLAVISISPDNGCSTFLICFIQKLLVSARVSESILLLKINHRKVVFSESTCTLISFMGGTNYFFRSWRCILIFWKLKRNNQVRRLWLVANLHHIVLVVAPRPQTPPPQPNEEPYSYGMSMSPMKRPDVQEEDNVTALLKAKVCHIPVRVDSCV